MFPEKYKKHNQLASLEQAEIDYTDIPMLLSFIKPSGGIVPSRVTRIPAKIQRHIRKAIHRARILGLIKYCDAHKTLTKNPRHA